MTQSAQNESSGMRGFITERDFAEAELEFPGITRFYRSCNRKPCTFLDLLVAFLAASRKAA